MSRIILAVLTGLHMMKTRLLLQRDANRFPLSPVPLFLALFLMLACGILEVGIDEKSTPASGVAALAAENARLATQVTGLAAENAHQATQVAVLATENARLATQVAEWKTGSERLATQVAALAAENAHQATQVAVLATENARLTTQVAALTRESARQATQVPVLSPSITADTEQWSLAGLMTVPRAGHTATLLRDGRVLLVGGFTAKDSAEIYDLTTNTFSPTGSLNTGRHEHSAALLPDGRMLVVGGYNNGYLASAEIYDPATGQWTPASRSSTTAS
jgi:cell division protein FtsB